MFGRPRDVHDHEQIGWLSACQSSNQDPCPEPFRIFWWRFRKALDLNAYRSAARSAFYERVVPRFVAEEESSRISSADKFGSGRKIEPPTGNLSAWPCANQDSLLIFALAQGSPRRPAEGLLSKYRGDFRSQLVGATFLHGVQATGRL
jgi:hypothetical protein